MLRVGVVHYRASFASSLHMGNGLHPVATVMVAASEWRAKGDNKLTLWIENHARGLRGGYA